MRTGLHHLITAMVIIMLIPAATLGDTWYVDGTSGDNDNDGESWGDALRTIQAAVDSADDGDEIWVRQGEYTLYSPISIESSVSLYGGFPAGESSPGWTDRDWSGNTTTVNGRGSNRCFFVGDDEPLQVTIDGFTITGGNNMDGAGVYNAFSSLRLANCTFTGNDGTLGGAVHNFNGTGRRSYTADVVIENCTFMNNTAQSGGAVYTNEDSQVRVTRCIFRGNSADSSGGALLNAGNTRCTVENCLFAGNKTTSFSSNGGAVFNSRVDRFQVMNSTFYGNDAWYGEGGALYNDEDSWPECTLTNSVFWGNSAFRYADIRNAGRDEYPSTYPEPPGTVSFCTIEQDGYDGYNSNISDNPLFVSTIGISPASWNLRLRAGSPCIDTATRRDAPAIDLEGTTRPQGAGYDRGAYEYVSQQDIAVDRTAIDFGEVTSGQTAAQSITISNNGQGDLVVSSISVTDAVNFSVTFSETFTLEPGDVSVVTVTFHPASAARFDSDLRIQSNDPDEALVTVSLSGIGIVPGYHSLVWIAEGQGTVSLDPPGGVYSEGSSVELRASPAAGWQFAGWEGDLEGTANPSTILMDADKAVTATFTQVYPADDSDLDGVSDTEEQGPDGTDTGYDGNSDGTPDSAQANVVSTHTHGAAYYVTLASPSGTAIADVSVSGLPASAPADYSFPFGIIGFRVRNVGEGGSASISLYLPGGSTCDTYYKYSEDSDAWEDFSFDGVTGAEINANVITLHFVDGLRGDQDNEPGVIDDAGTPALSAAPGAEEKDTSPDNVCFVTTARTGHRMHRTSPVSLVPAWLPGLLTTLISRPERS